MQHILLKVSGNLIRYILYISVFLFICCSNSNSTIASFLSNSQDKSHTGIDSLINSISGDSTALSNMLLLAESTDDIYSQMRINDKLGNIYTNKYLFTESILHHKKYLDHATELNDTINIIKSLNKLSLDYSNINSYNEASEYYLKALSLINNYKENDYNIEIEKATTLRGLGYIYLIVKQFNDALGYLQESLQLDLENNNHKGEAESLLYLGKLQEQFNNNDSAHYYYTQSLDRYIKLNSVSGISESYEHIGNLYLKNNDYDGARVYFESSYNTISHTSDKLNYLKACLSLGNINTKTGNYKSAKEKLLEGLNVSNELQLPVYKVRVHHLLSELYKREGKTALALEERILSEKYSDDYRVERNINRILQLRLEYEKALNDKEKLELIESHKMNEESNRKTIKASLSIIIILLVFILFILQYFKLQKRKNEAVYELEMLKSGFYINISQEFKTPVSIINGLVDRLKRNIEDEVVQRNEVDLEILSRQSKNLRILVDGISSISNLQENNKGGEIINDNIIIYLKNIFETFSVLAEIKKIKYEFFSEVSDLRVDYKPEYITVIMNNLITRAFSHCSDNDIISVSVMTDRNNKNFIIQISSTGNGKIKSTNADIAFTRELVNRINGSLELNKESINYIFSVTLPIINRVNTDIIHQYNIKKEINTISQNTGVPTVLIVENNYDLSYYISSVLKDKYNIIIESSSQKAIGTSHTEKPDLIISGLIFPQINGYEFCREIRKSKETSGIPIILITRSSSREERVLGIKNGADSTISQPIYEAELLALVEQQLSIKKETKEKPAQTYKIDKATIESNTENDSNTNDYSNSYFINQVTEIIYKEINNTYNLIDTISSQVCLSTSQLNRRIKSITGMTTSNYILKVRLNRAKKQLSTTSKMIGDIALDCGFNDLAYFSRSFKKEYGITPTTVQRLPQSVN